ncbi:MAG: hypothetical protein ACOVP5_06160 [Chitinophagales bacterium]
MNYKLACHLMITLLGVVLLFHLSIITGLVDFKLVWGGRLKTQEEMFVFESISLALNAYLLLIILQKANWIKQLFSPKVQNVSLWIFTVIFSLNTLGNLLANNLFEKIAGTAMTLFSAYACWIIVRKKESTSS